MGNSVSDWKEGRQDIYRDRYENVPLGTSRLISRTLSGTSESITGQNTWYSAGRASRMIDINHPMFYRWLRIRSKYRNVRAIRDYDFGHGLALERAELSMPNSNLHTNIRLGTTGWQYYDGLFAPTVTYKSAMQNLGLGRALTIPAELGCDLTQLWGYGSTAIKRSLPDIPDFSLPRFLGELREGLPKIPGAIVKSERKLRSVGGEYLNFQFGVAPTVSDLQKLYEILTKSGVRQAVRQEIGKEYASRKTLDKGKTVTVTDLSGNPAEYATLPSSWTSAIKCSTERTQSFKIWSSCSFAYYQAAALDQLIADLEQKAGMGLVPTAIDAWNLIGWSWLVDWFVNLNDIATNLSYLGKNGLYLQRGYVMGHYVDEVVHRQSRVFMGIPVSTQGTISYERKYRVKASPFGFGLKLKDLNPFQLSILASLGINKLRI